MASWQVPRMSQGCLTLVKRKGVHVKYEELVTVRMSRRERDRLDQAAERAGVKTSEFVRRTLASAADGQLRRDPPVSQSPNTVPSP